MFFILYKADQTPKPIYKSENQVNQGGMFRFGRVFSDTDKLADSKDGQDIIIKVFQHDRAGNHKCVVT